MAHLVIIMCICIQSHACVKGDVSGNPQSKKNPKVHLCSQACALYPSIKSCGRRVFLGPDAMGNVPCLMGRIQDWELSDFSNISGFSLILGQVI